MITCTCMRTISVLIKSMTLTIYKAISCSERDNWLATMEEKFESKIMKYVPLVEFLDYLRQLISSGCVRQRRILKVKLDDSEKG